MHMHGTARHENASLYHPYKNTTYSKRKCTYMKKEGVPEWKVGSVVAQSNEESFSTSQGSCQKI